MVFIGGDEWRRTEGNGGVLLEQKKRRSYMVVALKMDGMDDLVISTSPLNEDFRHWIFTSCFHKTYSLIREIFKDTKLVEA